MEHEAPGNVAAEVHSKPYARKGAVAVPGRKVDRVQKLAVDARSGREPPDKRRLSPRTLKQLYRGGAFGPTPTSVREVPFDEAAAMFVIKAAEDLHLADHVPPSSKPDGPFGAFAPNTATLERVKGIEPSS